VYLTRQPLVYDGGSLSMNTPPRPRYRAALHACVVVAAYTILFTWLFSGAIRTHGYLAESDLYEYYLPIFLAPITTWSSFEFSGLPAFADPGDFTSYPPHFVFARIIGSWTGFVISAFVMASAFTYAYVYRVTRSRTAAAFAGLAYGMSEALVERIPHLGTLHCFAWLPLILLGIEELHGEHRRMGLAIGAFGLACAFLSGHPQPAVYTFYVAGLYALVSGLVRRSDLRYYGSTAAMFTIAMLIASIKAIPLVEASVLMARQQVNYGQFVGHANTPSQLLSILFPTVLHEGREAPTYVGLATLVLAFVGASLARRNWRPMFWVCIAMLALLLGAGDSTPIPRIVYAVVPLYAKFRVGARHLFLAAFGAAFLAGYGIAAIQRREVTASRVRLCITVFAALILAGAAVQAWSPGAIEYEGRRHPELALPIWNAAVWVQLVIAIVTAGAVWLLSHGRRVVTCVALAAGVLVADNLNSLPWPVTRTGLDFGTIPRAAASPSVHATRLGRELAPLHQRALAFGGTQSDAVLPAAFARLWQIPIAGGYGPMLLERYSQLGTMGTNGSVSPDVLALYDVSLDLMSVKYVLMQPADMPAVTTFESSGLTWDTRELGLPVGRPDCNQHYVRRTSIPVPHGLIVSAIGFVTHMRCSEHLPQGAAVATIRVVDARGVAHEEQWQAGVETAEIGLGDPEQVQRVQHHQPAHVFADPQIAPTSRFFTRIAMPAPEQLRRIDIETPDTGGWLTIDRVTFVDADGRSHPASSPGVWLDDTDRWSEVDRFATSRVSDRGSDENAPGESMYTVVENRRALPRVWITSESLAISDADAIEAVHRGLLPDGRRFDPRQTALVSPDEGPPPGPFATGPARAEVEQISDGRITVAVTTSGGGFVVLSESHYPGWRPRIDGTLAQLRRTDVALQGVVVPPGSHTVEFELASTTQRAGAALSISGVLVCAVLLLSDLRTRTGAQPSPQNVA